jgi:CRISPR-associated Csx2 family protein
MKLITFLGTGTYSETEYVLDGQPPITTCYAPVASCRFVQADKVVVFATEQAEQTHAQALKEALKLPDENIHFVPVPKGAKEPELWAIFSRVAENVVPGEELAFDVTHGLRSFPLVGLLAAAFLRVGFGIQLRAVFYGAFDVRDQSVIPHRTPMFDLTPMLTLLEWAAASDRFNRTGDSRYFASLLREEQKRLALQAQKNPAQLAKIGQIGKLASALTNLSQSLSLIRPHQVMQQAEHLTLQAQNALSVLSQSSAALPFQMLFDSTLQAYRPLALADPAADARQDLLIQRELIRWYAQREHWMQAVSLAREWLVSWLMLQLGMNNLTSLSDRHRIEGVVNSEAEEFLKAKKENLAFQPVFLKSIPELDTALGLWKALTDTRNDIDHAGMRENPETPENLTKNITTYIAMLNALPIGHPQAHTQNLQS